MLVRTNPTRPCPRINRVVPRDDNLQDDPEPLWAAGYNIVAIHTRGQVFSGRVRVRFVSRDGAAPDVREPIVVPLMPSCAARRYETTDQKPRTSCPYVAFWPWSPIGN